jgi:hypothetical protein
VADDFSARYGGLLTGSYDCVDRIVLNAYYPLGHNPGGFRTWWRRFHDGSDDQLDDTHLIRMAGRFARRVRAYAAAGGIPVIDCKRGERKHRVAEEYLATHTVGTGVFMILVARAPARVWEIRRSSAGVIGNIAKKIAYVNHYSFHIMDPEWGHVTIKMSGHPPFAAQVILNGHEYVAIAARAAGVEFSKEGNCFTGTADPQGLAQIAETVSRPGIVGRLSQVCDRWIYSACLCFGLDLAEQGMSGFRYDYTVYQAEYSRNLLFRNGGQMDRVFNTLLDRVRSRLDVPVLRTMFGARKRPGKYGPAELSPRLGTVLETPAWDLTVFKVHFGLLTLKGYTKGEHVLRFEAIAHNTRQLRCGRSLQRFPEVVTRLHGMCERFCTTLDCVDVSFIPGDALDQLPLPSHLGSTRTGGIDLSKPRMRAALSAALALAPAPGGFTVADFTARVAAMSGHAGYTTRQAAYDLRKLRGKTLAVKPARTRRYEIPPDAARAITALLTLRDQVIAPPPGRHPSPPPRPHPCHLDPGRPRLRGTPDPHEHPLPRPRHPDHSRIDNILSIMDP